MTKAFKSYGVTATIDVTHLNVTQGSASVAPRRHADGDRNAGVRCAATTFPAAALDSSLDALTVAMVAASRTLVERQRAATAALGITTVVAAGDSGSSACAHGVPTAQLTSADEQQSASWPATSPWVPA